MLKWRKSGRNAVLRPAALVASAIFHVILLILLVRYLASTSVYVEPPAIQVSLVPPLRSDRTHRDGADRALPSDHHPLARAESSLPIQPLSAPNGDVPPFAPGAAAPGEAERAAKRPQVLSGLRRCDPARLTLEERERCEAERWARVAAAPTARLNLDPSGRYARNPEPFLLRRPKNGCRARAGGDVDVRGDDSNVRAGITCVVPF